MADDELDPAPPDGPEGRDGVAAEEIESQNFQADPAESFSPDRFFESKSLLPSLNTEVFDAITAGLTAGLPNLSDELAGIRRAVSKATMSDFTKNLSNMSDSLVPKSKYSALDEVLAQYNPMRSTLDFAKFAGLSDKTLSAKNFFQNTDEANYAYSAAMVTPASYFERDEVVVDTFEELNKEISKLIRMNPGLPIVWRGQQNHQWGLQSGLYRALQIKNGVQPPNGKPVGVQPHPTETQLQVAESKLISYARENWRLDDMPALELLARLQHYGAPTRLLDVSRNPYIAAWFAVESSPETEDFDSRLFAFGTRPVPKKGEEALVRGADTHVRLSEVPHTPMPFWHYWLPGKERREADWGTGSKRRVWVPPAYDQRIVSQDAAFILDGVPIMSAKTASYFRRGGKNEYWNKADLLAAASIYAKTVKPHSKPKANAPNFSPTFTFRITKDAKWDIREVLERRFSYSYSTVYPDISATGRYLNDHFDELTD